MAMTNIDPDLARLERIERDAALAANRAAIAADGVSAVLVHLERIDELLVRVLPMLEEAERRLGGRRSFGRKRGGYAATEAED